jgi:hypothetical protein
MNKTMSKLFLCLFVVAALGYAQTTTTSTTLNGAMGLNDQTLTLTASTGVTAAGLGPVTGLYIDREFMTVRSTVTADGTGNTWNVKRSVGGVQAAHATSAKVWVGPLSVFDLGSKVKSGSCTATLQQYLPVISVLTGDLMTCGNGYWSVVGASFANRITIGAQLTAAATITFTNSLHHITSSATTISTISAPSLPATGGCVTLIPDAAMTGLTTSTGGNIALGTTAVANKALILCYDPVQSKWYPSY